MYEVQSNNLQYCGCNDINVKFITRVKPTSRIKTLPLFKAVSSIASVAGVIKAALVSQAGQGVPGRATRRRLSAPTVRVPVPRRTRRLSDTRRTTRSAHETKEPRLLLVCYVVLIILCHVVKEIHSNI